MPHNDNARREIIDGEPKIVVSQHELLMNIDWIIIGGESGHDTGKYRYRPCKIEWIELLVNQCREADVPVFVKQLGTHISKEMKLGDRHGGNIDEFPEHLRIREFPKIKSHENNPSQPI
jgi:protein gp37